MQISVITVCYNAATILKSTIESVYRQKSNDYEYVIVDGGSQDSTLEILKAYESLFAERQIPFKCISEKDKGIYDAMNKGVQLAHGDYILFMNGGDSFYDEEVINKLEDTINKFEADVYYGRTMMIFYEGRGIYNENEEQGDPIMPFIHQSVIVKRQLLLDHPFDLSYKVLADREFFYWMRQQNMKFHYEPYIVSTYDAREGGSENNPYLIAIEGDRILGLDKKPLYFLRKFKLWLKKAPIQPIKNTAPRWLLNKYFLWKRKNIEWVEKY